MGRPRLYTDEERKLRKKEYNAKYSQANKEKIAEYQAEYRKAHKEEKAEYQAEYYQANKGKFVEYRKTPYGRALMLLSSYVREDRKYNRIGDVLSDNYITAQWIVDNIFPKPCHYCGESDWTKIGCDRIDNSLPHTIDNVVPCCYECNTKRQTTDYEEFKQSIINKKFKDKDEN